MSEINKYKIKYKINLCDSETNKNIQIGKNFRKYLS